MTTAEVHADERAHDPGWRERAEISEGEAGGAHRRAGAPEAGPGESRTGTSNSSSIRFRTLNSSLDRSVLARTRILRRRRRKGSTSRRRPFTIPILTSLNITIGWSLTHEMPCCKQVNACLIAIKPRRAPVHLPIWICVAQSLSALTVWGDPAKVPPHVATDPMSGQERGGMIPRREWASRLRSSAHTGGIDARSGDPKDGDAFRRVSSLTGEGGSWTISPPVRRARGRGGRRFRW